jgi:hypothetical protein
MPIISSIMEPTVRQWPNIGLPKLCHGFPESFKAGSLYFR